MVALGALTCFCLIPHDACRTNVGGYSRCELCFGLSAVLTLQRRAEVANALIFGKVLPKCVVQD